MSSREFLISYDELPISANNYVKPTSRMVNGKPVGYLYETRKAKDFKKRFRAYLKREVRKQGWNIKDTTDGHWYLDCTFIQSRINEDSNNYFKILCDSLTGVVTNDDKNLLPRVDRVLYDSKNPRFYATLRKSKFTGVWRDQDHFDKFFNDNCLSCSKKVDSCTILRRAKESRLNDDEIPMSRGFNVCNKKKPAKKQLK